MKKDPKGSNWRKWDLHVHTPESIINEYPGEKEDAWKAFLGDLENLPPEFKVIGINDYIFLDGYRRVLEERKKGRLQNIALILPVVELRVDMFGGSDKLSRINFHVVFSDEVSADNIERQFINALDKLYFVDDKKDEWSAIPTRDSLRDFGQTLIDNTPSEKRRDLPSAEKHGFNNLNFNLDNIRKLLENTYFKNKHLKAIGKSEWSKFPWGNQFAADKKSLINGVDFVLTASKIVEEYERGIKQLKKDGVNSRLIHASDAHALSSSDKPDRIGNSLTWIKSDTTFEGLRQALKRFDHRVFVGEMPEKIESVKNNPTKYIKSVKIEKTNPKFDEVWFENLEIEFNHGLVAIIGNKGSAKSALTDIIGFLGDSSCDENHFSFLHKDKFHQKPETKSKHFNATLNWENSRETCKNLNEIKSENQIELVKYVPQNFFEKVCSEIAKGEDTKFDDELKDVIFSHVEISERLGKTTLKELQKHKTAEIDQIIEQLLSKLSKQNALIIEHEQRASSEYKLQIQGKLDVKKRELAAHIASKPTEVADPAKSGKLENSTATAITEKKERISKLDTQISSLKLNKIDLTDEIDRLEKANNKIERLRTYFEDFKAEFLSLGLKNLSIDSIATLKIDTSSLQKETERVKTEIVELDLKLDENQTSSLVAMKKTLENEIGELQKTLDEPNKAFQAYKKSLLSWEQTRKEIEESNPQDSIKYYENLIKDIDKLPNQIRLLQDERKKISQNIFGQIERKASEFKKLYSPVQKFIEGHHLAQDFDLAFDVSIVNLNRDFQTRFFEFIDQGKAGSFCGKANGLDFLETIISKYDFNSVVDSTRFVNEIIDCLNEDKRDSRAEVKEISSQLKSGKSVEALYDFIFSFNFLSPHYVLKMLGKEMIQLSPGEKGTLLLVFYLLIDKNDIPLIIDQPEENLDNETVVKFLVPAIEQAKKRRQMFIVTHNPNLAVVCDAEQVIRANIDKKGKNKVEYICGSIENPDMNLHLLDVLEGTSRAFKIRHSSYSLTE